MFVLCVCTPSPRDPRKPHLSAPRRRVRRVRRPQERESYARSSKARLLERSVFSDRMVFVRALRASQDLQQHELTIYDSWFG
jgi:hypothetical protein